MAGQNSVKILRGRAAVLDSKYAAETLEDGQPLYDKTNNWLSIGNGSSIGARKPISVDFTQDALSPTQVENIWGSTESLENESSSSSMEIDTTSHTNKVYLVGYDAANKKLVQSNVYAGPDYIWYEYTNKTGTTQYRIGESKTARRTGTAGSWSITHDFNNYAQQFSNIQNKLTEHDNTLSSLRNTINKNTTSLSEKLEQLNSRNNISIIVNGGLEPADYLCSSYTIESPGLYIFQTKGTDTPILQLYKDRYYNNNTLVMEEILADTDVSNFRVMVLLVPENKSTYAGQRVFCGFSDGSISILSANFGLEAFVYDRRCKYIVKAADSTKTAQFRVWKVGDTSNAKKFSNYWS